MSEVDFRVLFECAPGLYLILLPNLQIAAVSDSYLSATMTKREEILGRDLFEVFPDNPDDLQATGVSNLRISLNFVLENRKPHTMAVQKYDIRRPDGTFEERFWSPLNKPVLNEQGEVIYIIHRVEDVTEFMRIQQEKAKQQTLTADLRRLLEETEIELYKRAQEIQETNKNLMKANRFLNSILQNMPSMLFIKDANELKFVRFNKSGEELLGLKTEELIGKNDYDFFPKEQADFFVAKDRLVLAGHDIVDIPEESIQTKHKGLRTLHTKKVSIRNDQGEPEYLLGISQDITEQKKAVEALRISEERLALVLDSGQMGAWDLDLLKDTAIRSIKHDQIFGYNSLLPEWGRQVFLSHVFPEDRNDVLEQFHKAFASGDLEFECRIIRVDQAVRWISVRGRTLFNEDGTPVRMLGIVSDITERKEAESELYRLNAQLKSANDELDAFSYSVSHDLRAPLRSIDGFSLAILKDYNDKLDDQGKDYLRRVRRASQKMAELIDDLLNLSRITRTEMKREFVDLSAIARDVAQELERADPARRVDIHIEDGAVVEGDSRLLRTTIMNLMANAWKYTAKNPEARVEFGVKNDDERKTYFVRDNGAGFDMAYAGKLFAPFQRLHSSTEFEGTGIGLAIVQRILMRHGGSIRAEGIVNKGATFYFSV